MYRFLVFFPASQHQFNPDFHSFLYKLARLVSLEPHVVRSDFRRKTDGLHLIFLLLGFLFPLLFCLTVKVLAIIHYFGYWRLGVWHDFYQIKPPFLGGFQSFRKRKHADLSAVFVNYAQFRSGYLVIYSLFNKIFYK